VSNASNQKGAIGTFIIVAVVLLLAVGGVAWLANMRGNNQQNPPIATQDQEVQPEEPTETESEPPPSEDSANNTDETTSGSNQDEVADESASDEEVPATGPTDVLAGAASMGALGFAGSQYLSSRRRLAKFARG
jgi:cytoskeletal protein RodZ